MAASSVLLINRMAFDRLTREEMDLHRGEYAVLVGGEIASYHTTSGGALEAGCEKYGNGEFSVLRVEPQPIEFEFSGRLAEAILSRTISAPPR